MLANLHIFLVGGGGGEARNWKRNVKALQKDCLNFL